MHKYFRDESPVGGDNNNRDGDVDEALDAEVSVALSLVESDAEADEVNDAEANDTDQSHGSTEVDGTGSCSFLNHLCGLND